MSEGLRRRHRRQRTDRQRLRADSVRTGGEPADRNARSRAPADGHRRGQRPERGRRRRAGPAPAGVRGTGRRRRPGPPRRILRAGGNPPGPAAAARLARPGRHAGRVRIHQRGGDGRALDLRLPVAIRKRAHRLHQGRGVARARGRGGAAATRHDQGVRSLGRRAGHAGRPGRGLRRGPSGRSPGAAHATGVHAPPRRVPALVRRRHRARPAGVRPARHVRAAAPHHCPADPALRRPRHRGGDRRPGRRANAGVGAGRRSSRPTRCARRSCCGRPESARPRSAGTSTTSRRSWRPSA